MTFHTRRRSARSAAGRSMRPLRDLRNSLLQFRRECPVSDLVCRGLMVAERIGIDV